MAQIIGWNDIDALDKPYFLAQIKEIFYLTTPKKSFPSENDKEKWWQKWTSYYFKSCPESLWVAIEHNRVQGYIMGCPDSEKALKDLEEAQPSLSVFQDLISTFPAHLHINCHPQATGQGIGSRLLNKFIEQLTDLKSKGVHIVTNSTARNVSFYERNGFEKVESRPFGNFEFLFMGRRI